MGGQACKVKAILNGGTIQSEVEHLCYMIQEPETELPDAEGYKIVGLLNLAEDLVFQAKRVFLESQGFNGPWPRSLTMKPEEYSHKVQ